MRTVAGIDYARFEPICQELRRARGTVAQHENIGNASRRAVSL
jgi:hypothetical protein